MTGFRKKEWFLSHYGEVEGNRRYDFAVKQRVRRKARTDANRQIKLTGDDEADVLTGRGIRCLGCGIVTTRLQWTHFANKCLVKTLAEYKKRFSNTELVAPLLRKNAAVTIDGMIALYGEAEGQKRWDNYRAKQAETNTLEYKKAKYGMTKEEFKAYNVSRSVTIANLIARHGEEEGQRRWDEYCERQRHTTSLEYFVEKYGEVAGTAKFKSFCSSRILNGQGISSAENKLSELLSGFDRQFFLVDYDRPYDLGCVTRKIVIEYQGTMWHADPRKYDADWSNPVSGKKASAVWQRDADKAKKAQESGYRIYTVWEADFKKDMDATLSQLLGWIDGTEQTGTSCKSSESRTTR